MAFALRMVLVLLVSLLAISCNTVPSRGIVPHGSISIDQPEIFESAALQAEFDLLRGQLSQLGIVDTTTLTAALGNVQGTSLTQTSLSAQIVVPATALASSSSSPVPAAATPPAAPTAPTVPGVAADSIGILNKQLELESQLQGYQLLLQGSDFARYTRNGLAKDRIVIGFPISLEPQPQHRNMAAVVEFLYFPPNAGQFPPVGLCDQKAYPTVKTDGHHGNPEYRFSQSDALNATAACEEQESTPTIINILPVQRTYNTVGISSNSASFGLGAVVGTVTGAIGGGESKQTQYLIAQQDTVALQGHGSVSCTEELIEIAARSSKQHCILGTRGIRFKWQFRPVLGEPYVRAGIRRTFVQLAIPNDRRPYPFYGGVVYAKTSWRPFDHFTGVVSDPSQDFLSDAGTASDTGLDVPRHATDASESSITIKNVFGHTVVGSEITKIDTYDQGGGVVQVSLNGTFLTGAAVRIGSTILNGTTPGFLLNYNSLKFVATAQSLAQNGAYLISSEGLETHIDLDSMCKYWDDQYECNIRSDGAHRPRIERVRVFPISDTASVVEVQLNLHLHIPSPRFEHALGEPPPSEKRDDPRCDLRAIERSDNEAVAYPDTYYHYRKDSDGDVDGDINQRAPETREPRTLNGCNLSEFVNNLPIVLTVGGKTYGLVDAPFQSVSYFQHRESHTEGTLIAVVASNDSLNASPQVKVQTLFGRPQEDPEPQYFVPPGNVTVAADPLFLAKQAALKAKQASAPSGAKSNLGDTALLLSADGAVGKKTQPPQKADDPSNPCDGDQCHYLVSGADVQEMYIPQPGNRPIADCPSVEESGYSTNCSKGQDLGTFAPTSYFENNSRGLITPTCARQVTLIYTHRTLEHSCFIGELIVSLNGKTTTPSSSANVGSPANAGLTPHFSLVRSVPQVTESGGTATLTVGIKSLKDQTATVTVTSADIVSAKDGSGNALPVQVGNNVVVSQDTNITLQVRNYTLENGVNVTAEGKNGTVSTGKLSFLNKFNIVKEAGATGGNSGPKTSQ